MKDQIAFPITPQLLGKFFNDVIGNQEKIRGDFVSTQLFRDTVESALHRFGLVEMIKNVNTLVSIDDALLPLEPQDFVPRIEPEQYYNYKVFVTTLRRHLRNKMDSSKSVSDGRFERAISPPLSAYEYHGADKTTNVWESSDTYSFLDR